MVYSVGFLLELFECIHNSQSFQFQTVEEVPPFAFPNCLVLVSFPGVVSQFSVSVRDFAGQSCQVVVSYAVFIPGTIVPGKTRIIPKLDLKIASSSICRWSHFILSQHFLSSCYNCCRWLALSQSCCAQRCLLTWSQLPKKHQKKIWVFSKRFRSQIGTLLPVCGVNCLVSSHSFILRGSWLIKVTIKLCLLASFGKTLVQMRLPLWSFPRHTTSALIGLSVFWKFELCR